MNALDDLDDVLSHRSGEVHLPMVLIERAKRPLERMLSFSE